MLPEYFTGIDIFLYAALWWTVSVIIRQRR